MDITSLIMAGDRRHSPYPALRPQEKPAPQGTATGTFEEALRKAMALAS